MKVKFSYLFLKGLFFWSCLVFFSGQSAFARWCPYCMHCGGGAAQRAQANMFTAALAVGVFSEMAADPERLEISKDELRSEVLKTFNHLKETSPSDFAQVRRVIAMSSNPTVNPDDPGTYPLDGVMARNANELEAVGAGRNPVRDYAEQCVDSALKGANPLEWIKKGIEKTVKDDIWKYIMVPAGQWVCNNGSKICRAAGAATGSTISWGMGMAGTSVGAAGAGTCGAVITAGALLGQSVAVISNRGMAEPEYSDYGIGDQVALTIEGCAQTVESWGEIIRESFDNLRPKSPQNANQGTYRDSLK